MTGWTVEQVAASAARLHEVGEEPVERRRVRVGQVTDAAVVLGSTQRRALVDEASAAALGLGVVRRRTGGGLVLVAPGAQVWLDLWLPPADPLVVTDVSRSFDWLGRVWQEALAALGVEADVHGGPLACGRWGRTFCFAGMGPGELSVAGRKVVGLAQRRGRWGVRFQASALLAWPAEHLAAVVAQAPEGREALADDLRAVAAPISVDEDALARTVIAALPG